MTIEPYSEKYFLQVVSLIENFHAEAVGEYDDMFDKNSVIETIKNSDPSNAFLLVVDGVCQGLLFGVVFNSMLNGRKIFQEIIWYVNAPFRRYGVKLLKEAEKILKSSGIGIIIMAVLENSKTVKLKRFYERLGYKPMEVHYVRSL